MADLINWKDTGTASFNVIKDGKPVDEPTVNTTISNITGNLDYLYQRVSNLEVDKGAVVVYNTDVLIGEAEGMLPGTPVYWVPPEGTIGHWSTAHIAIREATDDENSNYYWTYDDCALVQGIVLRGYAEENKVDVCLSGKVTFDVKQDSTGIWYIHDQASNVSPKPLLDLFNHHGDGGDETLPSAFNVTPDSGSDTLDFKSGIFYLSEIEGGKLVPRSQYTRVVALMIMEKVVGGYTLNTLVCPEGFGGEKFHIHKSELLGSSLGGSYNSSVIPDSWYPTIIEGVKYLNTAVGEINEQGIVYPYSGLVGAGGSSNANAAKLLYTNSTSTYWLSASDLYFTGSGTTATRIAKLQGEDAIPSDAIWGFAIDRIDAFTPEVGSEEMVWRVPVDPDHILLTMDGQLVPNSYYKINAAGVWWLKDGLENAPISDFFGEGVSQTREVQILFIDALGESGGGPVNQIESEELISVKGTTGIVNIETKDTYLSQPMIPVLPFNPMDDIERASIDEVEAVETEKIMTPLTTHHALEHFVALTEMDSQRSCIEHGGNWSSLVKSGFYKVVTATDGPKDSEESSPLGLVGAVGNQIFQFELGKSASFVRVGSGADPDSPGYWGEWMIITEKPYDPLYLPQSNDNTIDTTPLSLEDHNGRTIISRHESTNKVTLPGLTGEGYEDGLEFRFVNEMTPSSENSTLIIDLGGTLSGYSATYLVCPGQACIPADHHMGLGIYSSINNETVTGVPPYLDVSVSARRTEVGSNTLVINDIYTGPPTSEHTGSPRYVTFECEAPQYYGSNSICLEILNGVWTVTGGYGIWFALNDAEYEQYVVNSKAATSGGVVLLESLLDRAESLTSGGEPGIVNYDNSKAALKFTTRQIRVPIVGGAVTLASWGRARFTAIGGIF